MCICVYIINKFPAVGIVGTWHLQRVILLSANQSVMSDDGDDDDDGCSVCPQTCPFISDVPLFFVRFCLWTLAHFYFCPQMPIYLLHYSLVYGFPRTTPFLFLGALTSTMEYRD